MDMRCTELLPQRQTNANRMDRSMEAVIDVGKVATQHQTVTSGKQSAITVGKCPHQAGMSEQATSWQDGLWACTAD